MPLDERSLEEKLEALERVRSWSPRVVSKLEALLRAPDDSELFRVNVIELAEQKNIAESEAIDLFLHAAKLGLFNIEWQLICPQCTDAVDSLKSLSSIGRSYHCDLCTTEIETSLDDLIQVTFTVSPTVRRLSLHDPESLPIEDYCFRYHFSTGARAADGRKWSDCIRGFVAMMGYVEPGATGRFELELHPGKLKGADRANRAEFIFNVRAGRASEPQRIALVLENGACVPAAAELDSGPAVVEVYNALPTRAAIVAVNVGPDRIPPRPQLPRFLTGKQLFVSQTFADLFRFETVNRQTGLALKDLTFVFTDLKGSTELYERIGDLQAFHLVDQHFERLANVVRAHDGAIVKTIGDAVMATFASPADGVSGALEMLAAIERFNRERGRDDLILKIGVHRGASIAVTLNERLDYFGQTINTAARIQGLADAGEICLSDDVLKAPGVAELLASKEVVAEDARLKGISRALRVYRALARPA